MPEFLSGEEAGYKVLLPRSSHFDLPKFYPWLLTEKNSDTPSWEVSFALSGVPLKISPAKNAVGEPVVSWVKPSPVSYAWQTRDIISGSGAHFSLSKNGMRTMRLLLSPE